MSSRIFDIGIFLSFVMLIIGGVFTGKAAFYLMAIEVAALLFIVAYMKCNYSLLTEAAHSLIELAFFPKTRHWLLVLFLLLNGLVAYEVISAGKST